MTEAEPPGQEPQIFISYSRGDGESLAAAVRSALDDAGYAATGDWMLAPGGLWTEQLERLRRQANGAVVIVTANALSSDEVSREARAFYQRGITEPGFAVIPLLAEDISVAELSTSALAWLADFQIPLAPVFSDRLAETVSSLSRGITVSREPESVVTTGPQAPDVPAFTSIRLDAVATIAVGAPVSALTWGVMEGRPVAVTGDENGTIQIWELATGKRLRAPIAGQGGAIWAITLGERAGSLVAVTGGEDGVLRLWDLMADRVYGALEGHTGPVNSVAVDYTPAGQLIAVSGSDDRTVRAWDLDELIPLGTSTEHDDWVNGVAIGEMSGYLVAVSGSTDRTVRVWDIANDEPRAVLRGHTDSVSCVTAGNIDGRSVAVSGSLDGTIRIWDLNEGRPIAATTAHEGGVRAVAYGTWDGSRPLVVSGGNDQVVRVWNLDGNVETEPLIGHVAAVRAVELGNLDSSMAVLSGGDDGTLRVWRQSADTPRREQVEWLPDAPAEQDLLRRRPLAHAIALRLNRFNEEDPSTSFLVHIDGPWGTGKSTLLNFLRAELEQNWIAVYFDAWRQSRIGPPWWALLAALRHDLARQASWPARVRLRLAESWARSRRAGAPFVFAMSVLIAAAATVLILLGPRRLNLASAGDVARAVTAVVTALGALWAGALVAGRFLLWDSARGARMFEQSNANPMQDVAGHFGWLVTKANRPVVFFIDDLDRCSETYVVEFLEAVQTLVRDAGKQSPGGVGHTGSAASFVVAADGAWIRRSFEIAFEKFESSIAEPGRPLGYLFLDKLFQLRVPVPSIDSSRRQEFLRELLRVRQQDATAPLVDVQEQAVRDSLRRSSTETEVLQSLRGATPEVRDRVAVAALEKLTTPEVTAATEHSLQRFGSLLGANPRSMKRFVNEYSVLRAIRTLEGNAVRSEPLALWAILETQWPALADYLRGKPEAVQCFGKPVAELEAIPADLRLLFSDPSVCLLVDFKYGGPLTAELISSCSGGA